MHERVFFIYIYLVIKSNKIKAIMRGQCSLQQAIIYTVQLYRFHLAAPLTLLSSYHLAWAQFCRHQIITHR